MWFKVDDNLPTSGKVLSIPRAEGRRVAALGLWTLAGAWSAKQEKDGLIPGYMVEELGAAQAQADDLVAAGMWLAVDEGYQFHNWEEYQPTRDELAERREATRQRVAASRARRRAERENTEVTNSVSNPVSNDDVRDGNNVTDALVTPLYNPPEPEPEPETSNDVPKTKSLEPLFERAYQAWPKKTERKRSAEKFKAKAKLFADPVELVEHIERFAASYAATTDRQHTPALNVWLNGERWTDDLPGAVIANPWGTPNPGPTRGESPTDAARRVADELRAMEGQGYEAQRDW